MRRRDEFERIGVAVRGTLRMRPGGGFTRRDAATTWTEAKMVPIRFPAKLHEQLKSWCEEHDFPMAAVVRGLVERFLESERLT
jgi:hypothetical protein